MIQAVTFSSPSYLEVTLTGPNLSNFGHVFTIPKKGHGLNHRVLVATLLETNSSHLKMDGWSWNTISFPFWDGPAYFQVQTCCSFQVRVPGYPGPMEKILDTFLATPSCCKTSSAKPLIFGHRSAKPNWAKETAWCKRPFNTLSNSWCRKSS